MDAALHWYMSWVRAQILRNWGKSEWIWCHDVMVEAGKPRWLHPTFTLYIYKVFEHLKMLWIGSWMRPCTDTSAEGGPRFWEIGVSLSEYDAMMSWLRLVSPADFIPLSHYIYKVFEHLKMLWIGLWMRPYTSQKPCKQLAGLCSQ